MTLIVCPQCGRKNRVGPRAEGVPRCGNCHNLLPCRMVSRDWLDRNRERTAKA